MKNTAYYKKKFNESEMSSPYNKSGAFKRAGDYSLETGQRLSKEEADDLIAEEGSGSVVSTYQDAVDRAKTPEEKAEAEARMEELKSTEEGRDLIEKDKAETEYLEGTYDEGRTPGEQTFSIATDDIDPEGTLVEGWARKNKRQKRD